MFIDIHDLELRPQEFNVALPPGTLDLGEGAVQTAPLESRGRAELLREEHGGRNNQVLDIRLTGRYSTRYEMPCARCLEQVAFRAEGEFDQMFRPLHAGGETGEHSITESETEIGFYTGEGLQLEDALKEQLLLQMPSKPLCKEDCKGLCPRCGLNRNLESCACEPVVADSRWNALATVREKLKK